MKSDTLDRATATSSRRSCGAEIKGWHDNLKDPALGATLAVKKYGKDLEAHVEEQTLESKAQNKLILTADTEDERPLHHHRRAASTRTSTRSALAGIDITEDKLFDMSVINEVYDGEPRAEDARPSTRRRS